MRRNSGSCPQKRRRHLVRLALSCLLPFLAGPAAAQAIDACTSPPGEAEELRLGEDGVTLSWMPPADSGGSVPVFDTLRSPDLHGFGDGADCVESNGDDTESIDPTFPPPGIVLGYLPRAENECGMGPLGAGSSGETRPNGTLCGACLSDATCDDGLFCTGAELCEQTGECRPGLPPACAPFACDEGAGRCHASCADDGQCDPGATCLGSACVAAVDVTSTADEPDADPADGVCVTAAGECTLRAAVQHTNAIPGLQVIRLGEAVYLLARVGVGEDGGATGDLDLLDDVVVRGLSATRTWVDGQSVDRLFHVLPGVTATVERLTVQRGAVPDGSGGGGIFNQGNLTLDHSSVNGCQTEGSGGGIFNEAGASLALIGSTLSYNVAGQNGGGIASDGDLVASISTISTNRAGMAGGGIYQGPRAVADLTNLTVYRNGAATGGGLDPGGGVMSLVNTVVANSQSGGDCSAPPFSRGHNLASDLSCDLTSPGDLQATDPLLADLLVYLDAGIRTHFPLDPSPTIDGGDPGATPPVDQNGIDLTASPSIGSAAWLPASDSLRRGRAYVGGLGKIHIFETLTNSPTGEVTGYGADDLAIHPDGTRLYALNEATNQIVVINTATKGAVTVITPWGTAQALAIHPAGTYLFVVGYVTSTQLTIWAIDTATNQIDGFADHFNPDPGYPMFRDVGVSPVGTYVLAAGSDSLELAFTADDQLNPVPLGPWSGFFYPVQIAPSAGIHLFIGDTNANAFWEDDHRIAILGNAAVGAVQAVDLPAYEGELVEGMAAHPDGGLLYASLGPDLYVMHWYTGQILATLTNQGGGRLAIHPLGGILYSSYEFTLDVISTFTNSVLQFHVVTGDKGPVVVKP